MSTQQTPKNPNPLLEEWLTKKVDGRIFDASYLPQKVTGLPGFLKSTLIRLLGISPLIPRHDSIPPNLTAQKFSEEGLKALDIPLKVDGDLEHIPKEGPLIIVSNHPFGGIDGMALMSKLLQVRPDAKLLINIALGVFPDLRSNCLPLDVLSNDAQSRALNMASLRMASSHLEQGGAVVFFPSGTVSHWQWRKGVTDPQWQSTPARLAIRHNAPVLPIHFHGRNSTAFNLAGLIHPLFRTMLLPSEMRKHIGKEMRFSIGRIVEPATFKFLGTPESIMAYLRMRCYAMGDKEQQLIATATPQERPMEPIAEPHDSSTLAEALRALPDDCLYLREGDYAIYVIKSGQSPLLLEELGALREHTFRLAGEGSGKSRDLDTYDDRYYHMLLWHEKDKRLAGAYRLGKVQEILASHGEAGLYTTSLFRMNKEFFRRYENGLELGRAVVHPNYQREYAPLMLLWKGIGQFLIRHEDIRCLFGPVSLSLDYAPSSLRTAIEYLKEQCGSSELSSMVKGRYFPEKLFTRSRNNFPLPDTLNYNGLVALVRDIEGGRGIPILFKHYLKLGGKIAAFHMDTAFNTLDAFLLMDLVESPRFMLDRYMTKEGAETFLTRWKA